MPLKRCSFISNGLDHSHQPPKEQLVDDVVPMFEKPLTPSDVGKLNRLVIPKQHAEKYFPLAGRLGSGDSALLLSFEDEEASGRWWRFRFSHWSSSHSYVLTKGWNRYVKEKGLEAGDLVRFGCHRVESRQWFIGWRRKRWLEPKIGDGIGTSSVKCVDIVFPGEATANISSALSGRPCDAGRRINFNSDLRQFGQPFGVGVHHTDRGSIDNIIRENQATEEGIKSTRLRLFGVNLECQQLDCDSTRSSSALETSSLLSPGATSHQHLESQFHYSSSSQSIYDNVVHEAI